MRNSSRFWAMPNEIGAREGVRPLIRVDVQGVDIAEVSRLER